MEEIELGASHKLRGCASQKLIEQSRECSLRLSHQGLPTGIPRDYLGIPGAFVGGDRARDVLHPEVGILKETFLEFDWDWMGSRDGGPMVVWRCHESCMCILQGLLGIPPYS